MNLRLAFIIDGFSGTVKYTMEVEHLKAVELAPSDIVVVNSNFDTVRPEVYYDFDTKLLVPIKQMQLHIVGAKITGIPVGSVAHVDDIDVMVDDGELEVEGVSGAVRTVVIRCLHYKPAIVSVTCEGYTQ